MDLKICLYVDNILSKKSSKIALKNSNLDTKELYENKEIIDEKILYGRMGIIYEEIMKHKTNGSKLAKKIGISVNEIYSWYFKGKEGDEYYKDFSILYEFGVILPRVTAYKSALKIGIPQKWLDKKLKKDIGLTDYKIWKKHQLLDKEYDDLVDIEAKKIDNSELNSLLKKIHSSRTSVRKVKEDEAIDTITKVLFGENVKSATVFIKQAEILPRN